VRGRGCGGGGPRRRRPASPAPAALTGGQSVKAAGTTRSR